VKYYVYIIEIPGVTDVVYIGRTNNFETRMKQHLYCMFSSPKNKAYNKVFYVKCREVYNKKDDALQGLKTNVYCVTKTKTESKRWEMYLILKRLLIDKLPLYQKVPVIKDR